MNNFDDYNPSRFEGVLLNLVLGKITNHSEPQIVYDQYLTFLEDLKTNYGTEYNLE